MVGVYETFLGRNLFFRVVSVDVVEVLWRDARSVGIVEVEVGGEFEEWLDIFIVVETGCGLEMGAWGGIDILGTDRRRMEESRDGELLPFLRKGRMVPTLLRDGMLGIG